MVLYNSCLMAMYINALAAGLFAPNPRQARFQRAKKILITYRQRVDGVFAGITSRERETLQHKQRF
jgi:hypothetical protein